MVRVSDKDKQNRVLSLIHSGGLSQKRIAYIMGISPNNLNNRIKRYEKNGLILRKNKTIYLTEKGLNSIPRHIGDKCIFSISKGESIRQHNVRIRVPLRDKIDNPQVFLMSQGIDFRNMGLRNVHAGSFDLDKYIIELMPQAGIIIMPDLEVPLNTSIEDLAAQTWVRLESVLNRLERRMGLRFKRPEKNFFIGELISRHIAFTKNPLAESVRGVISGIWVIEYSESDGKPSLIVDFSNEAELEAIHRKDALMDTDLIKKNLGEFIKNVKSGDFRERQRTQERILGSLYKDVHAIRKRGALSNNLKEGFRLGLIAFIKKHEKDSPKEELIKEYYGLVRNYLI